jgi:hypothetical protein
MQGREPVAISHGQFRGYVCRDTAGKIRGSGDIEGYGDHTPLQTSEKCGEPGSRVLSPYKNAVALPDLSIIEFGRERMSKLCEVAVGGPDLTQTVQSNDCGLITVPGEVKEEGRQVQPGRPAAHQYRTSGTPVLTLTGPFCHEQEPRISADEFV